MIGVFENMTGIIAKVVMLINKDKEFAFLLSVNYYLNVGFVSLLRVVGPVVGFICGGLLLQFYTHFNNVDSSTSVYAVCYSKTAYPQVTESVIKPDRQ